MKIDPNSPAFPQSVNVSTQPGHYTSVTAHPGLPIRLHLAAMAMQAIIADCSRSEGGFDTTENFGTDNAAENQYQTVAADACAMADALIAEYNKEEPKS